MCHSNLKVSLRSFTPIGFPLDLFHQHLVSHCLALETANLENGVLYRRKGLYGTDISLFLHQFGHALTDNLDQISEWILLAIAYVFVGLRVYARLFRAREKLAWSDILLIISAFNALALIICDTLTFQMGVLDNYEVSVKLSKVRSTST
jgi:hypothetical protein